MKCLHWVAALGLYVAMTTSSLAQKQITVGYTAVPDFAAAFIAKERGFFQKRGLDVQLQLITLTSNVPAAVISDSVQIGGTTPPILLQAVDSGLDLMVLANGALHDNSRNYINIVARTGSNIKTAQDMVGKKFGVPGLGGTLHVLVRRWLLTKGVDPKGVSFVEVPIAQIADVLKGGSLDAAITGEPFVSRIVQTQVGSVVAGFGAETPSGFSTVLYTATRKWAVGHSSEIKAFREALAEAIVFSNEHRDDAYVDVGKYFKVPAPVLKAIPWPTLVAQVEEAPMRFWTDTMLNQDMLRKQPMVSSLILK